MEKTKEFRNTKEYRAWKAMKARCYSESMQGGNYKKNKIEVCEEWKNSFFTFLNDMGYSPDNNYSLDRIDNLKGYNKDNCRWTSTMVQSNNRSEFNKIFTYNGESKTLKEWSRFLGIKYTTLHSRIYRYNLSFIEAIKKDPFNRLITIDGKTKILKEWAKHFNINYQLVTGRIHEGWEIEKALVTPKVIKI